MKRTIFGLILFLLIFKTGINSAQSLDSCGLNDKHELTLSESNFLNTYLQKQRNDFDFLQKKIAFLSGYSIKYKTTKSKFFQLIKSQVDVRKYYLQVIPFNSTDKANSGGFDGFILYDEKLKLDSVSISEIAQLIGGKEIKQTVRKDVLSLGAGLGQDYGGIGVNLVFYPQTNIGLFAGFGYALIGLGYNVGTKIRLGSRYSKSKLNPSFMAMYGYHTIVSIEGSSPAKKIFYGFTLGPSLDISFNAQNNSYLSLAVLVPIRTNEVKDYLDIQRKANHISLFILPVTFSIGFHSRIF